MFSPALLAVSRNRWIREFVTASPMGRRVAGRFVAGEDLSTVSVTVERLADSGLWATIDCLGEDVTERSQATHTREAYIELLNLLERAGLAPAAEVSVKLSALGQSLPGDGPVVATANAHAICEAARRAGTTVTLDMEDHTTIDSTLETLRNLRDDFPSVGAVFQAALVRTEADVQDFAHEGSRVRLVKGAYAEPRSVAYVKKAEVDRAYKRCLAVLFAQNAYPMVATHDQAMIDEANRLATLYGRRSTDFELQMLYGIRTSEQMRQASEGKRVRVYVPYGQDWYGYFARRLAERPANLGFLLRSLAAG